MKRCLATAEMGNKFQTLLENTVTRHSISKIQDTSINAQLRNLVDIDMVNFFIFARVDRINQILDAASQEKYFGKKYSWFAVSKVRFFHQWDPSNVVLSVLDDDISKSATVRRRTAKYRSAPKTRPSSSPTWR